MAIYLIGKIKPKNNGTFAMVDAADVEMPDGTRLSDFKGGVTSVNGIKPDENGEVTVETEIPVFDLVSMGLPTIEVDGLPSDVNTDLTEIGAALEKGPVKLLIKTSLDGVEETTTCIGTGFYKPNDDTWQVVSRVHYNNKMITGVANFILSQNAINAFSFTEQTAVTDEHINDLIDAKLGVIENGSY